MRPVKFTPELVYDSSISNPMWNFFFNKTIYFFLKFFINTSILRKKVFDWLILLIASIILVVTWRISSWLISPFSSVDYTLLKSMWLTLYILSDLKVVNWVWSYSTWLILLVCFQSVLGGCHCFLFRSL